LIKILMVIMAFCFAIVCSRIVYYLIDLKLPENNITNDNRRNK